MRQLALPFVHRPPPGAAGFIAAPSNERALAFLAASPGDWPFRRLWLWGPPGCGKTHLLQRWAGGRDAALLEAAAVPAIADDFDLSAASLAIDDADQVGDEPALLHFLNLAAERRIPVVLASRASPARLRAGLPDLASRLRATLAVGISDPEDELLDALLVRLLADRQLAVPPGVVRYLRLRLPREPDALRHAAARLDAASLQAARPVTTALAANLFRAETSGPLDQAPAAR